MAARIHVTAHSRDGREIHEDDIDSLSKAVVSHLYIDEGTDIAINSRIQFGASWFDARDEFRSEVLQSFDCSKSKTGEHTFNQVKPYLDDNGIRNCATSTTDGASSL